tara:strand:+ start:13 stop:552 length:540 start_codon:yes stop_codon:yes gene_type:complete
MRKRKEVKVINRWKADEFNGEIPIGGDEEEMLGTAMNMANNLGDLAEAASKSMTVVRPLTWFMLYGGGGYVLGNTAMVYFGDEVAGADVDAKRLAYRAGYLVGSAALGLWANGLPSSIGEYARAGGVGLGSMALAARRSVAKPAMGRTSPMRTNLLRVGLASYGVASVTLLIDKVRGKL